MSKNMKEFLRYEPETGKLFWVKSPNIGVCAGDEAGGPVSGGYLRVKFKGKGYLSHRVAWFLMTEEWPPQQIDHINGVRTDNRWCNLRSVSPAENLKNCKIPKDNTSGTIGVVWNKNRETWHARIRAWGQELHLSSFKKKEDAIAARKSAEKKYGYHENHGRITCDLT